MATRRLPHADRRTSILEAARNAGNLAPDEIDPRNAWNLIEHVGSMITSSRLIGRSVIPDAGSKTKLLREASKEPVSKQAFHPTSARS